MIKAEDLAAASELFAAGSSVNAVAKQLFKGSWEKAKKLHAAWQESQGGAVADKPRKPGGKRTVAAVEEPAAAEDDAWDLSVRVPVDRVDALWNSFTLQEKMDAVCGVMQARIDLA